MSLNTITIIGRLVADPELRTTNTGKNVASLRVAVERKFKKEGEPDADFFRASCWGQQAEYVNNYGGKGRLVVVTGRMECRPYVDKDSGAKREVWEILADSVSLLDRPREDVTKPTQKVAEYDPFGDE